MQQKIIDNKQYGLVGDCLKENIKENSKISIAASHFTIHAFEELKEELSNIDKFKFLFAQPTFIKHKNKAIETKIRENENKIFGVDEERCYKSHLNQAYIAKELSKWIKNKAEIKSMKSKSLGESIYYIENEGKGDISITGGSPFSSPGLGYTNSALINHNQFTDNDKFNSELNTVLNKIWNNEDLVKDVKKEILEKISLLYKDNTPEFLYFITLYNIFKNFLDEHEDREVIQSRTGFKDTEVWNKLYNFQRDGVIGAINKIEKFGGCIIADSVGLGKTFEALAVIKYYELKNNKVLVLAPKKLRENWSIYRQQNDTRNPLGDDRFSYDLLNHTDLSRNGGMSGDIDLNYVNWGNYDLVVIDESHNFRNNQARNDRETRYTKFMNNIIKSGIKTKVLMLSATPVNNKLEDLKNQIAFITEGNDKALINTAEIESIKKTLSKAQSIFNKWGKTSQEERTTEELLEMLNWEYFKLLDSLTIARSRKHIEKYYNVTDIGEFSKRLEPINIKEDVDIKEEFPSLKSINADILRLNLAVYSPMKYILPHKIDIYESKYDTKIKGGKATFKQADRESSIVYLMKSSLLKRLESSVNSFTLTLSKILSNIEITLSKIDKFKGEYSYDIDDIGNLDEELEDFIIGSKVKILLNDMDIIKWKQGLEYDRVLLSNLLNQAKKVDETRDKKLKELKNLISNKIENPINEGNKKVIVFTAFADTAKYLYENINKWALKKYNVNTALVTGSDNPKTTLKLQKVDLSSVLINFSPRSKERSKLNPSMKSEIDILIATDCISEGQNLQDCDYLINYDIHWNPVRIIQRFGRVDRLGSTNKYIQLVNFWPSIELDEYINLETRVKQRMTMLDISATGEENVIAKNSNEMKDLEYRRNQLEKLQKEVIDLEDVSGNVSLTDFTMDDFRMDLINLMDKYDDIVDETPCCIYSLVKNENEKLEDEIKPGVIFCLKRIESYEDEPDKNPIYPYYLVYIDENGKILYSYTNVKKILDIYRSLCSGKGDIIKELIEDFNKETKNNKKMDKYINLLTKATDDILGKVEEQKTISIFSFGGLSNLVSGSNINSDDFEVISYLIIR
ncbi:helicase-related protein [Terrisporobacter glycolicus]|uniref:helicase-related protein n=1 Tax=Terrisporobacter glycolicus TaxID=36841 RepID=UPI003463FD38